MGVPRPPRASARHATGTAAGLAVRDPAVWVAVEFEAAHCQWDWREPLAAYVAAQQRYASPRYARQIAVAADPVSWAEEVVGSHESVTCTVSGPRRAADAPSTGSRVYARVTTDEQVVSAAGSFDVGAGQDAWVVQRLGGRWLVTGPFVGG